MLVATTFSYHILAIGCWTGRYCWAPLVNEYIGLLRVNEVGAHDTLSPVHPALAFADHIAVIGGLMGLGATVEEIYVGSSADFKKMLRFI